MSPDQLPVALASLRAEVVVDSNYDSKRAVRVSLPLGFKTTGYGGGVDFIQIGGFRSKAKAQEAVARIIAEVACKIVNAVINPERDPPHCTTGVAWVNIKVA
jgi:hypothetical protein